MISIPLYMYRVETNEFEHGLNFFQKVVLKFKAKLKIKNETIARLTGLDDELIAMVSDELQGKGLLSEHGSLSEKGREKLNEVEGLVVNSGKRRIGYVFKYLNQDKLYPYFIQRVDPADILEDKGKHPKIVTGTKGDGEDYTELPFFIDDLIVKKQTFNKPTEREVLQLIQNSNRKSEQKQEDEEKNNKLSKQLSIRFLKDQPEIVWVCTYIYLKENEEGTYEPDWRILDPFGFGDSVALKFYLSSPITKNLFTSINNKFKDETTTLNLKYSEFHEQLNLKIDEKLISDFEFGLSRLDSNKQQYVRILIEGKLKQEYSNFQNLYDSKGYHGKMIELFENILSDDRDARVGIYKEMLDKYYKDYNSRVSALNQLWKGRIFSSNYIVPQYLKSACKGSLYSPQGIGGTLVAFLLTYNIDNKSPLFNLLKNRIDDLIGVIELRNPDSHGKTIKEGILKPFPKEVVEKSYSFVKTFINDYIQQY